METEPSSLVAGQTVSFAYEHRYRVVQITSGPWVSKDGNELITGVDVDKGEYRSFRLDRIQNKIKIVR